MTVGFADHAFAVELTVLIAADVESCVFPDLSAETILKIVSEKALCQGSVVGEVPADALLDVGALHEHADLIAKELFVELYFQFLGVYLL